MQSYGRIFRNRPFLLLWAGQTISRLGDVLYYAAMLWLVKTLTQSNTITGLAGMAMALPQLIGPLAGVFVDRWPRRAILLVSDLLRGVMVLIVPLLAWAGVLNAWGVIGVVFMLSLVSQFFWPAKQAIVPELVDEEGIVLANSLDTMTVSGVNVFGFLLAGSLIIWLGPVQLFSLDGVSFFISALFIVLMGRLPLRQVAAGAEGAVGETGGAAVGAGSGNGKNGILQELWEGIEFLWRTPLTRLVIPAAVVINFVFGPTMVLLPSYASDVLHAGARGYGYLEGALAAGMLLGAAVVPALVRKLPQVALVSVALVAMGVALMGIGFSAHLPASLALMGAMGVFNAVVNVVFISLLQAMVPRNLQGRTFASLSALVSLANPIGLGLSGILADTFSVPAVYLAAGTVTLVTALALVLPMLRLARNGFGAPAPEVAPSD